MAKRFPFKDPGATLDYLLDWSPYLQPLGDTIVASEWTAQDGITVEQTTFTATDTTIWLSGGEDGVAYTLTNRITTSDGRVDERDCVLPVRNL